MIFSYNTDTTAILFFLKMLFTKKLSKLQNFHQMEGLGDWQFSAEQYLKEEFCKKMSVFFVAYNLHICAWNYHMKADLKNPGL